MKKQELENWEKKTKDWKNHGKKTTKQLFNKKDDEDENSVYHGGFWFAGYQQAITDFIYKYNKKLK